MRHGFIRPPLHFTSNPFAPYYSHLTVGARARHCVCVARGIVLYCECTCVRDEGKKKVNVGKEKER